MLELVVNNLSNVCIVEYNFFVKKNLSIICCMIEWLICCCMVFFFYFIIIKFISNIKI